MDTPPAAVPVIESERTILRAHRMEDFEAYAAMWADPAVTRFIGGRARTREESWQRFLRQFGLWSLLGYGFWAVEDKVSGRFIGEAGFHDLKRDIVPSIEGTPEAGWAFLPSVHGKGIATEVVGAVVAWGDKRFGRTRTVCLIDPDNAASLKVAGKHGFGEVMRAVYGGHPVILLQRQPR